MFDCVGEENNGTCTIAVSLCPFWADMCISVDPSFVRAEMSELNLSISSSQIFVRPFSAARCNGNLSSCRRTLITSILKSALYVVSDVGVGV